MKRRWLIGAGVAASAAGITLALRQRQNNQQPNLANLHPFWSLSVDRPDGTTFATQTLLGQPLLLNFWATWCPPCVKEFAELDRFAVQFKPKGWAVLGLALDSSEKVGAFLAKQPVSFLIGIAGMAGSDLVRSLGNKNGVLPFSVMFNSAGQPTWHKIGTTDLQELTQQAQSMPP